ncbi:DNA-processing protein DprA [Helcococcus kunzii]|uniref:DNA protecting protein DprA n=1 Tax=Helcococcus kunzii ATCC 51366 TaxID=883114 RepID=H3NNF6_9FIRM|nr:DNA-processing protein DprA [Helcococcus kunzii]EHR33931.1 DNA protecting protein DprA [Helcococcus kunzii ATCC 51366]QUY64782.1 DNA-protecting protein DprA [Helcococcus kunzii]
MYNHRRIILFLNIAGINNLRIINFISEGLLDYFLHLRKNSINRLFFLTNYEKDLLYDKFDSINIDEEMRKMYQLSIKFSTILDKNYPERLKKIYNAPAILYYKGEGFDEINQCLAIVGTRKPTNYGKWCTNKIVTELARYKISTVSGMALGIDAQVHTSSIESKIHTIGVLASSLEIEYPKTNKYIYNLMKNNLLISEFPLGTNPIKRNFVFRNRIISGISLGVLVIEAAEESGSLITANYAIEQNRDVFAIPGNINSIYSEGCNRLIKKGAKIIQNANDIIEEFSFLEEVNTLIPGDLSDKIDDKFTIEEMTVIKLLKDKILSIDDMSNITGININKLYAILVNLEINNIVINLNGNVYSLK